MFAGMFTITGANGFTIEGGSGFTGVSPTMEQNIFSGIFANISTSVITHKITTI